MTPTGIVQQRVSDRQTCVGSSADHNDIFFLLDLEVAPDLRIPSVEHVNMWLLD